MLVNKQNELMSDLLFPVHQYGGDDVTWKPLIIELQENDIYFLIDIKTFEIYLNNEKNKTIVIFVFIPKW